MVPVVYGLSLLCLAPATCAVAQPTATEKPHADKPPRQAPFTEADAKRVVELEQKVAELRRARKYTEAQDVARTLVDLRNKMHGPSHWKTIDAKWLLRTMEQTAGLPAEAQSELTEADQLGQEAHQLMQRGRYGDALPLAKRVLAIRRRYLGQEHPEVAEATKAVAYLLNQTGKHGEVEPLYRQVLAINQKVLGEEHPETATSYNNVAMILNLQGKYAEAEPFILKALAIFRKVLGETHLATIFSYNNLAGNLHNQGKYSKAERLFRTVLTLNQKLRGDNDLVTAGSYNNLGLNLQTQGQFAEAEPLFRKALAIQRRRGGETHPDTAISYNQLAINLEAQGKPAEAEPLLRKALAVRQSALGEENRRTANSYANLAVHLKQQGKVGEAETLHRRALAIRRKVLGEMHPDTASSYGRLADLLQDQARYDEAETLDRQALAINRKVLGEEHSDTAASYNNLAVCLRLQGKQEEAESLFRRALAINQKAVGEEHPHTVLSYSSLAFNRYLQGDYEEAEKLLRAAARSFESARLRTSFAGLERVPYAAEHSPLLLLTVCQARNGKASEAWQSWEASLARGLSDELSARLVRPLSEPERGREQELIGKLQLLDKQITALRSLKEQTAEHRQQLDKLQGQRDAVLLELDQHEAELSQKYGPAAGQAYDLARIQRQLPADAVLLGWLGVARKLQAASSQSDHWACLVRQRGDPLWVKLPGRGEHGAWTGIDDELPGRVRQLLVAPPEDATVRWQELAGQLYQQRLAPLIPHLRATKDLPAVRRIIVLPSPELAGIPVEALLAAGTDPRPGYTVSYVPSGTMLAWLQEKRAEARDRAEKRAGPRLLAVGDPVFAARLPRTDGPAFAPLPGTRREVIAIAELFEHADTLLGSAASEQRLEQLSASGRLQQYAFLHLATHGVIHKDIALHSALILSQDDLPDPLQQVMAGKRAYDGRLTAEQILRTWKLDATLVTLSACQTGLGQYQVGEGYLGFAQALFLAGGRSLVLSLWKVDDHATALLMTRFYQNLLGKRPGLDKPLAKAEALQEAKAWLRGLTAKEVDQRLAALPRGVERDRPPAIPAAVHPYAHPYYWAAFILIGDPK
jgi:CHAT domain-containing protein/tetratricopeptide (TPR) repeat protein